MNKIFFINKYCRTSQHSECPGFWNGFDFEFECECKCHRIRNNATDWLGKPDSAAPIKSEISEASIESNLLAKAPYKLHAVLDDDKITISASIKNKQVLGTKLHNNVIPNVSMRCGPAEFYYYGFPRDPSGSSNWKKYYTPVTMQRIEDMLIDHAGIRIYRDGFRVKPYGDAHNDWTHREDVARGRAGTLPNDRTIGWIEIHSDKNPQIIDTTTREKIIENKAFNDLVEFINASLQKLNSEIYKQRTKIFDRKTELDVDRNFSRITDSLKNVKMPSDTRSKVKKSVERTQNIVKEREGVLMTKLDAYRNLATIGITSGVVSHEIGGDLAQLINIATYLSDQEVYSSTFKSNILDLSERVNNIQSYMQTVRGYASTLKSNSSNFRKKQIINCHELVEKTLSGFSGVFQKNNIEFNSNIEKNLPLITMFRTDFQSILINFVTNSIKSLKVKGVSHAGQNFSSQNLTNKINVTFFTKDNNFIISFSDNGVGIDRRIKDTIFDIFTSYSMESNVEQDGSGLGLSIVNDIVENYQGLVYVDKPKFKGGATLTVEIPLEKLKMEDKG